MPPTTHDIEFEVVKGPTTGERGLTRFDGSGGCVQAKERSYVGRGSVFTSIYVYIYDKLPPPLPVFRHSTAVVVAYKQKMDLALGVALYIYM